MENSKNLSKSLNVFDLIFALFCFFTFLWFLLFALDKSPLLFELKLLSITYSFSVSGIFGLLAAFTYGWYLSGKYREVESAFEHFKFALGITVYTLLAYLIGLTLFSFFISS